MSTKVELQLTSGCLGRKGSVDQALVYRLEEGTAGCGLPVIHQSHPWAGKNVSALRDRLMIEWVMSFPESKKLLKRIVDDVTGTLRKPRSDCAAKSKSATVRVVVLCSNGAQLSPCFVEKLYEHFISEPPVVPGLSVSRRHRDALRGAWGSSRHSLWQVSCVPVHGKVASHFTEVFQSKMWLNFDPTANTKTEAQFRKDPFTSSVDFTDMVLDLESGTAYRKAEKKTYYIRCSDVSQPKANVWELSSIGYKSVARSFRAAGIQPYSVHPVTGEAVFLLGRLTYDQLVWCDFGGLKSYRFWSEGPRLTAARECYEETLGILGTAKQLADTLTDFRTNNCFKVVNVETQYVGHFMRIPYKNYPALFKKRVEDEMGHKPIEVDRMKWFPLSSLKSAVMIAHSEQFGVTQRHVKVKAVTEDGTVDESRSHNLRGPYVSTLCIADTLNFLDSIAAIAEHQHRAQSKPRGPSTSHKPSEEDDSLGTEPSNDGPAHSECVSTTTEEMSTPQEPELEKLAAAEASATPTAETGIDSIAGCSDQQTSDGNRDTVEDDSMSTDDDDDSSCSSENSEQSSSSGDEESNEIDETERSRKSSSPGAGRIAAELADRQKIKHHSQSKERHSRHLKHDKRKKKRIFFYGMGAGSFTVMGISEFL